MTPELLTCVHVGVCECGEGGWGEYGYGVVVVGVGVSGNIDVWARGEGRGLSGHGDACLPWLAWLPWLAMGVGHCFYIVVKNTSRTTSH